LAQVSVGIPTVSGNRILHTLFHEMNPIYLIGSIGYTLAIAVDGVSDLKVSLGEDAVRQSAACQPSISNLGLSLVQTDAVRHTSPRKGSVHKKTTSLQERLEARSLTRDASLKAKSMEQLSVDVNSNSVVAAESTDEGLADRLAVPQVEETVTLELESDEEEKKLAAAAASFAVREIQGTVSRKDKAVLLQLLNNQAQATEAQTEVHQGASARLVTTLDLSMQAAVRYADEAWTWGALMDKEYPNMVAFFFATGLLFFVVVGLFFCWADVERLAINNK